MTMSCTFAALEMTGKGQTSEYTIDHPIIKKHKFNKSLITTELPSKRYQ